MADDLNAPITTNPPPAAWYADFDDESKGFLQNRGLDKLDPAKAAAELLKSYREAANKIGIPPDRVLRIPEPNDADGWKAVHQKLGVPADPAGYDFSVVKQADGSAPDESFIAFMRNAAAKFNIPKDAATGVASALIEFADQAKAAAATSANAAVAVAHDGLRQSWGVNFETNKFIADRAASLMGITPEALTAIAGQTSYASVMEGLRRIGVSMGEASLIGNQGPGGGNQNRIMTREQAMARKSELINDRDWVTRWGKGEKAAIDEITNLDRLIVGVAR